MFCVERLVWHLTTCRGPPRHIMQCRLEDKQSQIRPRLSRGRFQIRQKQRFTEIPLRAGAKTLKSDDSVDVLGHIMRKRPCMLRSQGAVMASRNCHILQDSD